MRALLRALGVISIVLSFVIFVRAPHVPADPPPPAPPSPSPSPSVSPAPGAMRGGPITIGITGNLMAGQNISTGDTVGIATANANAGALINLQRRTANTATQVTLPTTFGAQGSALGQMTAEYDTTHNSYQYGTQTVGALGIVPIGQTARGITVLTPRRNGDVALYAGTSGLGTPTFLVRGARMRVVGRHGYGAFGVFDASAEGQSGRIDGVVAGYSSSPGKLSGQIEGAFERYADIHPNGDPGQPTINGSALAIQGRLDAGSATEYTSLTLRDLSPDYISLGGSTQADRYAGLSYRWQSRASQYTATFERDQTGDVGSVSDTTQHSLSLTAPFKHGSTLQATVADSSTFSVDDRNWNGTLNLSYMTPWHGAQVSGAAMWQRTTDAMSSSQSSAAYNFSVSRTLARITLQGQLALTRQNGSFGNDQSSTFTLGATQTAGKTSYTLSTQVGRQFEPGSALAFVEPTLSLSRRLSGMFVATVTGAFQFRRDALIPTSNAHGGQISFSIGAPFSFGNGVVSGRADPRLPGTISGVVQTDTSNALFAPQQSSGLNLGASNIAVVLDNQRVVRTDAQGRFSFNFLPAGEHEVTIDPTSLPRGLQAASPITAVNLQGGQTAQVVLTIGSYGAIDGTVEGKLAGGADTPIPDVGVMLDGKTRAVTDGHGRFAFGGLTPGKHKIALIPETFPATFGATGDETTNVDVATGAVSHVAFTGAPLGSIAGTLTFDPASGQTGGVENAYVVAEPGEHAAITDNDGTYLLDNLPAGTYTLSVDPETLADGLGVTSQAQVTVQLDPGGAVHGQNFTIGEAEKGVVFTFKSNDTMVINARALTRRAPPGGAVMIAATTSQAVQHLFAHAFGATVALTPRSDRKSWTGAVHVPAGTKSGAASVTVDTGSGGDNAQADFAVDAALPIASLALNPSNPARGQYVHVRAHILVDARKGDKIVWQDGSATLLPAPRAGRFFEFDVKVTTIPMHGTLVTHEGEFPLTLVR